LLRAPSICVARCRSVLHHILSELKMLATISLASASSSALRFCASVTAVTSRTLHHDPPSLNPTPELLRRRALVRIARYC